MLTFLFANLMGCTCADSSSESDWYLERLYQDNWRYLTTSPQQLAFKFQAMHDSSYDFMRGSLVLYLGHRARVSQERQATRFLQSAEATLLPIVGDAHPENVTICAEPSQETTLEFVDLDASDHGPWLLDVQRAAMALRIFGDQLNGCTMECQDTAVRSFSEGYLQAVQGNLFNVTDSQILQDLIEEGQEEGAGRKKYNKYVADGLIQRDEELDEAGKGIVSISSDDRMHSKVFAEFSRQRAGTERLLDAARRYGMGVSSRPAIRYVFLWDEGSDGPEDDRLMLAREVFDPPLYPGRINYPTGIFENNAQRVKSLTEELWINSNSDPNYKGVFVDGMAFKTVTWSSYFQSIDVEKIQEDWNEEELVQEDIVDLSQMIGASLGRIHSTAQSIEGGIGGEIITADIQAGGGRDVFHEEILQMSREEQLQLHYDHAWFQQRIKEKGLLLGMFNQ